MEPPPVTPVPPADDNLLVVHYSSELARDAAASTPAVSAVVVQHVLSGHQATFAAFSLAERAGLTPDRAAQAPAFERDMLDDFFRYATARPDAVWVHWGMRGMAFGFDVLAQRARVLGLDPVDIPPERRFDLSNYLKRRYGDDYAPNPRLWNVVRANLGAVPHLLTEGEAAAAWARGDHAAVLWSLSAKVKAIAKLFDRAWRGTFVCPAGDPTTRGGGTPLPVAVGGDGKPPPPGRADALATLTGRQWAILAELRTGQAFDRESALSTPAVARAVDGPKGNPGSFKRPVARLRVLGLVDTFTGKDGGVWLTPAGRAAVDGRNGA